MIILCGFELTWADVKRFPELERMCDRSHRRYVLLFRDQVFALSKRDDLRIYFDCRYQQMFVRYLAEAAESSEGRNVVSETLTYGPDFLVIRFVRPNRMYLSLSDLANPIIHDESGFLDLKLNISYLIQISMRGSRPRWDPVHRVLTSVVRRKVNIAGEDVDLALSLGVVRNNQLSLNQEFHYYDPYASVLGKAALTLQPFELKPPQRAIKYRLGSYAQLYNELARWNRTAPSFRESTLTPSRDERYCSDMLSSSSNFSSKRR